MVIKDGRNTTVGRRGSVQVPEDAQILSVEGHYVTAGFWNAHVHLNGFAGGADTLSDASLAEALQMRLGRWKADYNNFRPHGGLARSTPADFAAGALFTPGPERLENLRF